MQVIMISTDRNILKKGSAVQARMLEYGSLFKELHIIIFSLPNHKVPSYERLGDNVYVYTTSSSSKFFYIRDAVRLGIKIASNLKNKDKLILTTQDPFETGLAGWMIAKKVQASLNIQIHTDFGSSHFANTVLNKIRCKIAGFILPKADSVRVVSERIKNSLHNFNLKKEPTVLPIYVDIEKIEDTCPLFYLKQRYPEFETIIVMVARLEAEKNISLALKAFKEILRIHPRTGLVVVGDGSLRISLVQEAEHLHVLSNTIFEGWQEDSIAFLKTADIYLSTSAYEGFGLSLLEAAASGCPIVSTNVGLIGEELPYDSVIVADPTVASISAQVHTLIDNVELRNTLKTKAHEAIGKMKSKKTVYLRNYKKALS